MLQLTTRSDLQNYSFQIVIKQLETIKKQRLLNESQTTILKRETEGKQTAETPASSQLSMNLQQRQTV